jgi:hypothetical protein
MNDRTPEQILADWREAERANAAAPSPELAKRIDELRREHGSAIEARQDQADELAELSPLRSV